MNRIIFLGFLFAASVAHAAPVVGVDGALRVGNAPADGVFTATILVTDDTGTTLLTETIPSLLVVGGFFSVDLDLTDAAPVLRRGEGVSVQVEVDGAVGHQRLGPVFFSATADESDQAELALSALRIDGVTDAQLVDISAVASLQVAFANLTGLPAGIGDGDNGNVSLLGAGLAVQAGALNVGAGAVVSASVVDASLTSAQVADGAVSTNQLVLLPATNEHLADATLTGANFANGAIAAADVQTVGAFKHPVGCVNPNGVSVSNFCLRRTCGTNRLNNCTTNVCEDVGATPSFNTQRCFAGQGIVALGSLLNQP
jgi:hypothetical protein